MHLTTEHDPTPREGGRRPRLAGWHETPARITGLFPCLFVLAASCARVEPSEVVKIAIGLGFSAVALLCLAGAAVADVDVVERQMRGWEDADGRPADSGLRRQ